jgi:hypothetical protein
MRFTRVILTGVTQVEPNNGIAIWSLPLEPPGLAV